MNKPIKFPDGPRVIPCAESLQAGLHQRRLCVEMTNKNGQKKQQAAVMHVVILNKDTILPLFAKNDKTGYGAKKNLHPKELSVGLLNIL